MEDIEESAFFIDAQGQYRVGLTGTDGGSGMESMTCQENYDPRRAEVFIASWLYVGGATTFIQTAKLGAKFSHRE